MAHVNPGTDPFDSEELSPEDLENIKAALVYVLMENNNVDVEEIYSLVFHDGAKITWQ